MSKRELSTNAFEPDYYHYTEYANTHNNNTELCSKIELRFECKDLPNLDILSKSDPKIFIFLEQKTINTSGEQDIKWIKVGTTEKINNDLNPSFLKSFIIDYYFEMIQKLRFLVFDMDDNSDSFSSNDFIGYAEKNIGDLIGSNDIKNKYECDLLTTIPPNMNIKNKKVRNTTKKPKLIINIEQIQESNVTISMDVRGTNLDKMDFFGKSDPYFIISKTQEDGSSLQVYKSSVIKNTLNPIWTGVKIKEYILNSGDDDKMLLWEVYDWDRNKSPDFIGSFEASMNMIKQDYKNSGIMSFENITYSKEYSFIEFPMLGTQISVVFAIDFTGSNGEVTNPNSLHYRSPNCDYNNFSTLNEYQKAIAAVGYVLEPYDSTKYMEVYGYGARFFNRECVEFDCALTGDPNYPAVLGVNGILQVYAHALETVKIWGPTNFAPIINKIAEKTRIGLPPKNQNAPLAKYYILTIITDGEISDMENTKKAIINASDCPLSIIIIGVGSGNFNSMVELDGDEEKLNVNGKYAERDIVQFVPLSKFIDNPSLLACETLAEIPKQVIEFSKFYKYKPLYAP